MAQRSKCPSAARLASIVCPLVLALAVAFPAASEGAPLAAAFVVSPSSPQTGETVTFISLSTGTILGQAWDLDDDGACDDALGDRASTSFATSGPRAIKLCVGGFGEEITLRKTIVVRNRPPTASFTFSPQAPVAGQTLALTSLATDSDSPIAQQLWDLDGDGAFDDASGITASLVLPAAGVRRIGLAVVDKEGGLAIAQRDIQVGAPPPELLSPFPVVRMVGRLSKAGTTVRTFAIRAPRGALVTVRCRGRRCPYRRGSKRAGTKPVRFRRLERRLSVGTVIEVFVTGRGSVGKYTRFRIRRRLSPARVDRCVAPGTTRASRCPAGASRSRRAQREG